LQTSLWKNRIMKDKNVLIISSEVVPYLPQTEQAINSFEIPKNINDHGGQTRIFMPRYGMINERRHQLHEVIRLSGMNMIVNDLDVPLVIKVASIPKERMQVYFIDNDEYFKRRALLHDADGKIFSDNDERMIFFTKGVVETVKKLNWSPDIIHLHGWFTSLFPLYLKTFYKDEPLFADSQVVSSIYAQDFEGVLSSDMKDKVAFDQVEEDHLKTIETADYHHLTKLTVEHSDGLIIATEDFPADLKSLIDKSNKPYLAYEQIKESNAYIDFYTNKLS